MSGVYLVRMLLVLDRSVGVEGKLFLGVISMFLVGIGFEFGFDRFLLDSGVSRYRAGELVSRSNESGWYCRGSSGLFYFLENLGKDFNMYFCCGFRI